MTQMVSMKDYEGFGGFGPAASQSDVENFSKAIMAGHGTPGEFGGSALRVESLEATLRVLTFSQQHVKLWKDIPKLPAYNTSEEYTVQTSYGGEAGVFTREGELPQVQDASYDRRNAMVKYLGTQREVSHVMTLVRPAHGNIIALETQNGAIWLMERMERALFFGRSDIVPESWDGLDFQISADPIARANNVVDLRGGVLSENAVEQATNIIIENYGVPTDFYLAPRALSDIAKQFYPKERIALPAPTNGRVGLQISEIMTQAGPVALKSDMFLRSGKNNGVKRAPSSSTAVRAPAAPTVTGADAGATVGSLFAAGDIGTWQYKVTALNRFGESAAASVAGGVALAAAGDGVLLTITDGGGSDAATGYRIYRSPVGGAVGTEQVITEIPRVGITATTVVTDINGDLPNTSRAYMFQMNLQSMSFRQLAPMLKIPLATLAASIRWMQLLYGTPIVYAPRKNVIFKNVADD